MPTDFIELNRTFSYLSDNAGAEDQALMTYAPSLFGGGSNHKNWQELLTHRLVVLLGEPGSGKTYEIQHQVERLEKEGQYSFYIQLDLLVGNKFEQALAKDILDQLSAWKSSGKRAYFFVDSVDEAKYGNSKQFYVALDRLRDALGEHLTSATLILCSRITDWLPKQDKEVLDKSFALSQTIKGASNHFDAGETGARSVHKQNEDSVVVCLDPLIKEHVNILSQALAPDRANDFISAVDANYAWDYVRRPMDAKDLIGYWISKGALGSLTEIIEHSISSKLRPIRDTDILSPERAREGSEQLAAATILCRQFNISIENNVPNENVLNGTQCLDNSWHPNDYRQLIGRALFDGESYGKVRFHHRRISEYLAAKWIERLMSKGDLPISRLVNLFFETNGNEWILREHLGPVLAWLGCGKEPWCEEVRSWVVKNTPELFLQFGDPASFPPGYRKRLFESLIKKFQGRQRAWIESSRENVARIATKEIEDEVCRWLKDEANAIDLRCLLAELVGYGKLEKGYSLLGDIIFDSRQPGELRIVAAIALRDINSSSFKISILERAKVSTSLPNDIVASICEALYPELLSPDDFLNLLRKSHPVPPYSLGLNYHISLLLRTRMVASQAAELLSAFLELLTSPPYIQNGGSLHTISEKYWWIGECVQAIVNNLLLRSKLADDESQLVARGLVVLAECMTYGHLHDYEKTNYETVTQNHRNVRQAYFWILIRRWRQKEKGDPISSHQICAYHELLSLKKHDFGWLLENIGNGSDDADRLLALRFAMELWVGGNSSRQIRKQILQSIGDNENLKKNYRQLIVDAKLLPYRRFWYHQIKFKLAEKYWWERQASTIIRKWQWLRDQYVLLRHIKRLYSGQNISWLGSLVREADTNQHDRWTPNNWDGLRDKRGRIICYAAQKGCKSVWRKFNPTLPHESKTPNQTPYVAVVGLAGIQISFNDGDISLGKLTFEEVQKLTRYALHELNDYPKWFYDLVLIHPEPVKEILLKCIEAEWLYPEEHPDVHQVVQRLVWQAEPLAELVTENIEDMLSKGDPENTHIFNNVLTILSRRKNHSKQSLIDIARERLAFYKPSEIRSRIWLSLLLQLDANSAIDFLEKLSKSDKESDDYIVGVCARLKNDPVDRTPRFNDPDYLKPSSLKRLIPIVYEHVNPKDDQKHDGTFTPNARDDAEHFRASLLQGMLNQIGQEYDLTIDRLAKDKRMRSVRDYLYHMLELRSRRRASREPWLPQDIVQFAEEHEKNPKNDIDLNQIVLWRLEDIKHDVERADISIRSELAPKCLETRFREWLARKLKERAKKKYAINQETEVDFAKRPDLRIDNSNVHGPISVEMKLAHKWSYSELSDALRKQLVMQYMKDNEAHYGIYVLGLQGSKRQWRAGGRLIDFDNMVLSLQKEADKIVKARGDIYGIKVIGIDFRLKISKSKKGSMKSK